MYDLDSVKNLYKDGYRCIFYNNEETNPIIYLKNFENEDSKEIQFESEEKFIEFKDYLSTLRTQ